MSIATLSITEKNDALKQDLIVRAERKGLHGDDKHAYIFGTLRLVNRLRQRSAFKSQIVSSLVEKGRFLSTNSKGL